MNFMEDLRMDIHRLEFSDQDNLAPNLAASFLGGSAKPLSLSTLSNWRRDGIGPKFVRIGKSIRYPVHELRAFMEGQS